MYTKNAATGRAGYREKDRGQLILVRKGRI